MSSIVNYSVNEALAGQRLDNFIMRHFRQVPKSLVYKQIRTGQVRVNGKRKKADYRVSADDQVKLPNLNNIVGANTQKTTDINRAPKDDPLLSAAILFEDNDIIAINKRSGWAVHSGSGVTNGVIERFRAMRPDAEYLELVHRLDRGTSGCLLLAKSRAALTGLHEQLKGRHDIAKWYSAMCFHRAPFKAGKAYDCAKPVNTPKGIQRAHSRFEIVQQSDEGVLLDVEILTGRKHQIRQHCAMLEIPIMGDGQYGDFALNKTLPNALKKRLMLHAKRMEFLHPITDKKVIIAAPLPKEFNLELVGAD